MLHYLNMTLQMNMKYKHFSVPCSKFVVSDFIVENDVITVDIMTSSSLTELHGWKKGGGGGIALGVTFFNVSLGKALICRGVGDLVVPFANLKKKGEED